MDKQYGGYTMADLENLLKTCEEQDIGVDSLMGDEACASGIISDLMDEVNRLSQEKN